MMMLSLGWLFLFRRETAWGRAVLHWGLGAWGKSVLVDSRHGKKSSLILRYPGIPSNKNGLAPPSLPFKKR